MNTSAGRRRSRHRLQIATDLLTSGAILVAVAVVIWQNWPSPPPPPAAVPADPVALDGAIVKGNPAAAVVMIEFADFQCPYCGTFERQTMPNFDRQYVAGGRVRFAYHHLLGPSHERAVPAAVAAECAGRQGKFWEMHDLLFADQSKLDDNSLAAHSQTLGIDPVGFKTCQADATVAAGITRETTRARDLKIAGTPTFFIGTAQPDGRVRVRRALRGAVAFTDLQTAVDAELAGGLPARSFWLRPTTVTSAASAGLLLGLAFWLRHRRSLSTGIGAETPTATSEESQVR
jgi:protein-disulfide isomerase